MSTGKLIVKKEDFELLLKSQIESGYNLLNREISEDKTTFIQPRRIIRIKEYDESEKELFLADYKKWDSFNLELISRSFDENDSPYSYFMSYNRIGDCSKLFGEDTIREAKQQINEKIINLESIMNQLPLIPHFATNNNHDKDVKIDLENKNVFIVHGHDNGLKNVAAKIEKPVIFAIGNAPTALIQLYEMIQSGSYRPAFIIGVPVGFVNVEAAKDLILKTDVPYIINRGRKGGSNIAAAICNALLYELRDEN